ncbi:MAG: hypothetical protein CM15mP117_21710 [Alphaproteobacteria bacterium]|nr:MAG: hypothetical protein CM15mP117_21710 [Alphaproteobacteria bacterium]
MMLLKQPNFFFPNPIRWLDKMSDEFTHFNSSGQPYMIDVGNKAETNRKAVAKARIFMALSQ